jgi:ketosteroid isomerase-like protein
MQEHNPIEEIRKTEQQFAQKAADSGIEEAFLIFAASDAVLNRDDQLIHGKDAIAAYFKKHPFPPGSSLEWKPDFIDVSTSGDMAYTYGRYTYRYSDTEGNIQQKQGVFHTVWKKQKNGKWKFVWD